MTYMNQNFPLFHVLTLSVLNFLICLLVYPGSLTDPEGEDAGQCPEKTIRSFELTINI